MDASTRNPGSRFPPAEGERRRWAELPESVRTSLERHLGARVIDETSERGGFSPGVASRIVLSDGRRMFAKVVSAEANRDSPEFHRREARILAQLPPDLPVPRLLSVYDEGSWVALFLEEIAGRSPRLPWDPSELRRVLRGLENLLERLTPAPFDAPGFGELHRHQFREWHRISGSTDLRDQLRATFGPGALDRLAQLRELETRLDAAASGRTLLNSDVRADNVLLTDDRVYFADWPSACRAAPWVELALFLPSVAMQGGPEPWTLFDASPLSRDADPDAVDAVLAGLSGFLVGNSMKPPPPGLSTLRPFQRAQGVETLRWIGHRWEGE